MYGIALEGGGMRGAYHLGAMKGILECGYDIGGFVGTSIGAFNAAVLAQGDFKKLYNVWYNGSATLGIDVDEKELEKFVDKKWNVDTLKYWTKFFTSNVSNKGMDSTKLKTLYDSMIDEKKLRVSKYDYGMVTVSFTDKKPIYICKEEIPEGMISSYVLASSYLPVFKKDNLLQDDKVYIDGGFYDNCPVSILKKKGYKDIIQIQTNAIGVRKKINTKGLNIITINASKDLGSILFSDNKIIRNNIKMGYFDAVRTLKGYIGDKFYVVPTDDELVFNMLTKLTDEQILKIIKDTKVLGDIGNMEPKKILFGKLLPYISSKLKHMDVSSYQKTLISMMEYVSSDEIEIYKLYTFEELLKAFKSHIAGYDKKEKKAIIKNPTIQLILALLKNID